MHGNINLDMKSEKEEKLLKEEKRFKTRKITDIISKIT